MKLVCSRLCESEDTNVVSFGELRRVFQKTTLDV